MIDYSKITEEVKKSEFNQIKKIINSEVSVVFYLDYEYAMYSEDGKPQLKAAIYKWYNKNRFSVVVGISQEFLSYADINLDEFFITELENHYNRRDKTKDPK